MLCSFNKVIGVSLIALLVTACSSDNRYKREVSGDDSYLQSPELKQITVPAGLIVPIGSSTYIVDKAAVQGEVGKALDIRAPAQPFAGLEGSRGKYADGVASLFIANNQHMQNLWPQVNAIIKQKNITLVAQRESEQKLETDWVSWPRKDEDATYQGRYLITLQSQGSQLVLSSKLLELRRQLEPISDLIEVQRYSVAMLNTLSEALLQQQNSLEEQRINESMASNAIYLQSGSDETGLPNLIARASYAVTWARLPKALEQLGMSVVSREQSKGTITVKYNGLNDKGWQALGVSNPGIKETEYKIQLGDLNNRTSLQFSDSKGEFLKESQNKALIPALEAAFIK